LRTRLPVTDMQRIADKLDRLVDDIRSGEGTRTRRAPGDSKTLTWAVDARVANRAARLASAMREAGAVYLPERLHAVRIAVKKVRYAMELSADLRGDRKPESIAPLKRMQELLGRMHDLQVLIEHVREYQASLTPPSLQAWRELDELVTTLEDMCRRLHARYVHERDAVAGQLAKLETSSAHSTPGRAVRQAG
jgi:CHAD domain-containing protein